MSNNGGKRKVKVEAENVGRRASGVPMKFKKTLIKFGVYPLQPPKKDQKGAKAAPKKKEGGGGGKAKKKAS